MDKYGKINFAIIGIVEDIDYEKKRIKFNNEGEVFEINLMKTDIDKISVNQEIKIYMQTDEKSEFEYFVGYLSKSVRDFLAQIGSVPGVGFRTFTSIYETCISKGMTIKDICFEISVGNYDLISSVPGVGMKGARRIVDALKDIIVCEDISETEYSNEQISEAVGMLISLGFEQKDINVAIEKTDSFAGMMAQDIVQKLIPVIQTL